MTEENVKGIDGAGKRAGIILRLTAGLMDFFLFYTGGTYFFSLDTVSFEIFLLIVIAAAVLYEIVLQDTPAKKLLNMKTVYEKKTLVFYVLRPFLKYVLGAVSFLFKPFNRKRQWLHDRLTHSMVVRRPCRYWNLRAIGVILLVVNIFLTFGVGNLKWKAISKKIDLKRVNSVPERVPMEPVVVSGDSFTFWNDGWKIRLPRTFGGKKIESTYLSNIYGRTYTDENIPLGVYVAFLDLLHPCTICETEIGKDWRLALPCDQSYVDVQDAIFNVSSIDRLFAWNPIIMFRTNVLLLQKSKYIRGIGDDYFLRRLDRNGISIVWVYTEIPPRWESESHLYYFTDTLYLATPSRYNELHIMWNDTPRDEQLVWQLIGSLELWDPGPEDIEKEFELAGEQRSIPRAMNAFRMSNKKYEAGELLYQLLVEKGTAAEKKSFPFFIKDLGETDRRYKKLIYLTREWRGKRHRDEVSEKPTPEQIKAVVDSVMKKKK